MTLTQYAAAQVGCLYVSGGQGQKMTTALIRKLEKDDSDYKRALKKYNEHVKRNRHTHSSYDGRVSHEYERYQGVYKVRNIF